MCAASYQVKQSISLINKEVIGMTLAGKLKSIRKQAGM
jgi:hypothetical protein